MQLQFCGSPVAREPLQDAEGLSPGSRSTRAIPDGIPHPGEVNQLPGEDRQRGALFACLAPGLLKELAEDGRRGVVQPGALQVRRPPHHVPEGVARDSVPGGLFVELRRLPEAPLLGQNPRQGLASAGLGQLLTDCASFRPAPEGEQGSLVGVQGPAQALRPVRCPDLCPASGPASLGGQSDVHLRIPALVAQREQGVDQLRHIHLRTHLGQNPVRADQFGPTRPAGPQQQHAGPKHRVVIDRHHSPCLRMTHEGDSERRGTDRTSLTNCAFRPTKNGADLS